MKLHVYCDFFSIKERTELMCHHYHFDYSFILEKPFLSIVKINLLMKNITTIFSYFSFFAKHHRGVWRRWIRSHLWFKLKVGYLKSKRYAYFFILRDFLLYIVLTKIRFILSWVTHVVPMQHFFLFWWFMTISITTYTFFLLALTQFPFSEFFHSLKSDHYV